MNIWLLYGIAIDTPWDETLLKVCESEEAVREWAQIYLDTSQWISVFTQCWITSGMPEK